MDINKLANCVFQTLSGRTGHITEQHAHYPGPTLHLHRHRLATALSLSYSAPWQPHGGQSCSKGQGRTAPDLTRSRSVVLSQVDVSFTVFNLILRFVAAS